MHKQCNYCMCSLVVTFVIIIFLYNVLYPPQLPCHCSKLLEWLPLMEDLFSLSEPLEVSAPLAPPVKNSKTNYCADVLSSQSAKLRSSLQVKRLTAETTFRGHGDKFFVLKSTNRAIRAGPHFLVEKFITQGHILS